MTSNDQLFIPDQSPSCPVTGLPITGKPEWTDIQVDSDYFVTFNIIGKAILLITPKGKPSDKGTISLLEKREEIISDAGLSDKKYAELRDYRMLTAAPSKGGRLALTNFLLKEPLKGHLQGFWVFSVPLLISFMFRAGLKIHKSAIPVGVAKDYEDAIRGALKVLRQSGVDVGSKLYPRIKKDAWSLELEGCGMSFELIGDDVLYATAHGRLKEDHVEQFIGLLEKVISEAGLTQKGCFYRIVNWEGLSGSTWKARRMYMAGLNEIYKKTPCKLLVVFGLNKLMKTMVGISRPFVSTPTAVAKDLQDALEIIDRERQRDTAAGPEEKTQKRSAKTYTEEQLNDYANEMLQVVGEINWDQSGISPGAMSEDHPLNPVMDALSIIKLDLDNILREKESSQKSLQESEEKYRWVMDNIAEVITITDMDLRFTYASPSVMRLRGYTPEEVKAQTLEQTMTPESLQITARAFEEEMELEASGTADPARSRTLELSEYRKDGSIVWLEVSLSFLRDKAQKPLGIIAVARDITDRRRAEMKLLESEEKYRNILERIDDGYFEVDLAGNFTFFNAAMCKIIGYPREEMLGMNNRSYMDHENSKKVLQSFHEIYLTGVPTRDFEWEVTQKNGTRRDIEVSVSLIINPGEKPTGFRGVARDVTEKKLAVEASQQARMKAETESKAKSQFLATMSHEIRTPLNGILGMAETLLDTVLDEEQKHIASTITKEADSLRWIINTTLDFSKIEAGKLELELIPFDLRNLFEDVAESFLHRATEKGLELITFIPPETPTRIVGDPGRLRQILRNLIGNAIKFTHEGRIMVKAEMVQEQGEGIKLRFMVTDTGIGIPKEKQALVFESFTQADGSTTRKYGGTGLGITICKQLAELMGGEIGLESAEGKGSTFWITAVFSKQSETKVQKIKDASLADIRILVINGSKANREIIVEYVRSWGALALEAASAGKAISILRESIDGGARVHLILVEFNTWEMNGFDLVREIRSEEDFCSIPVIIITTVGNPGDGNTCKEIGIEGYLTKPVSEEDLRQAIVRVLQPKVAGDRAGEIHLVTKHTSAEMERKEIRILLAEDYPTNQEIARRHLVQAGYKVDVAENGQLALDAFKGKHYDLILMDVQMPVMDGCDATKAIREIEAQLAATENGKASQVKDRVPIVAMTGHALQEYKELCFKAGMDDFLSKPFIRKDLLAITAKWVNVKSKPATMNPISDIGQDVSPQAINTGLPIDLERALDEFQGDKELLTEVITGFAKKVSEQLVTIRQALSCGDAETVRIEAHSIKGGAAGLTAGDLAKVAFELENKGQSKDLTGAGGMVDALEREFQALLRYVEVNYPTGVILETPRSPEVFLDREALLCSVGGKEKLVNELTDYFIKDMPVQIQAMVEAIAGGDFTLLGRIAHRLKGAAATMCAHPIAELSGQIQLAAQEADMLKADALIKELREYFNCFNTNKVERVNP